MRTPNYMFFVISYCCYLVLLSGDYVLQEALYSSTGVCIDIFICGYINIDSDTILQFGVF